MENYKLGPTKYTLAVDFDAEAGRLELAGSSYPENAVEFFRPLLELVKQSLAEKNTLTVDFRLVYVNTSSTKCILDLLDLLEASSREGGTIQVNWFYQENDEDILEMGQEFSEDLQLTFTLVPWVS